MSKPLVEDFEKARLIRNQDYLWCPVCQIHVPCTRIPSGGWEVACPGCRGGMHAVSLLPEALLFRRP